MLEEVREKGKNNIYLISNEFCLIMIMRKIEEGIRFLQEVNHASKLPCLKDEQLFRALMNITMPIDLPEKFYQIQDEILDEERESHTIIDVESLEELKPHISLYLGNITFIKADVIVNACNEKLLGCFQPLHNCIDNAIHSFAGLQVRRDLIKIMNEQGHDEPNGKCKVTLGYNLPSKFIFHTVGPKVLYKVNQDNKTDLKNCYLSCLKKADELKLSSIVFCSISTGVYGYPIKEASRIAIQTVKDYLKNDKDTSVKRVIFDVFSEGDYDIYEQTIREIYK